MRFPLILMAAGALLYTTETEKWRADREAALRTPDGWLSVAGLFWLHEGDNDVVPHAGILRLHDGVVTYAGKTLKPDDPGPPDVVQAGSASFTIIKRGDRLGVRLRDPNANTRAHFSGLKWYPIDEAWRVRAKWIAQPKTIPIVNILGMTDQESSPGYAEFTLKGKTLRLTPVTEDDHLFFMLKDQTAGKTTYGAGRFLYSAMPKDGVVELDFNRAENPPCAFTAFATCPLPPRQNWLPVAIEAGEKKYGAH